MNRGHIMKKIVWVLLGISLLPLRAFSQDTSGGCGLGWAVTKRMSLLSSSIRATTNSYLPNTFSMTSGTSGCAKHSIVKNDEKAVIFAVNNYDSLMVEMAEGRGEYLQSFAQSLGCRDSKFGRFSTLIQSRYNVIAADPAGDGINLYKAVRGAVQEDPVLSLDCVPVGTV